MTPSAAAAGPVPNASGFAIDVHDLNKSFGDKHVVVDVSLQMRPGEIMGFLGPNGSGKTTCMRMMCGLLRLDSGSGTCLGYDIVRERAGPPPRRLHDAEVLVLGRPDDPREPRLRGSPLRDAEPPAGRRPCPRRPRPGGALEPARRRALRREEAAPGDGACMLYEPKLLLLDEPTSGVDPTARRDFWIELRRVASTGISVLLSTHYMDEAQLCNQLAYIAYGELLAKGSEREVIKAQHLATWSRSGADTVALTDRLRGLPGAAHVVPLRIDLARQRPRRRGTAHRAR